MCAHTTYALWVLHGARYADRQLTADVVTAAAAAASGRGVTLLCKD